MHVIHIDGVNFDPSLLRDVVQIVNTAAHGIAMTSVINGALAQIDRLLHGEILPVIRVQNAVRVRRPGPHREVPPVQARAVVVYVVQLRTRLVPSGDHGPHAQSVPAVRAHGVREELRRGRDRDALLVPELVQPALHAEVPLPEGAVGGAPRHRPQEEWVDFDDLLDGTGRDVRAHGRAGVDAHDDAAVELEREGRRALGEFDGLAHVAVAAGGGEVVPAEVRRLGVCAR